MNTSELKDTTKQFAIEVVCLVGRLPRNRVAGVLGRQLLQCGTSVEANYRAACRTKSQADLIAKMRIVEEEVDEAIYWVELLVVSGAVESEGAQPMLAEANKLVSIVGSSINTAKRSLSIREPELLYS